MSSHSLKALLWMIFGSALMVALIITMNLREKAKDQGASDKKTKMEVVQKAKPKTQAAPKPKPKPKPKKRASQAPMPNLGSSLAGVDLGIPEFAVGDLMGSGESLLGDVSKDMTMTESTVDSVPRAAQRAALEYPKQAKRKGITGYVLFNLLIGKEGNVIRTKILESQPQGVFDDVATASIKQWKFEPAMYKNEAVKVWAKQKISFQFQ
ncbi:MAG: TonB family protein [Campylobacterota bacterium]|nr:TonB family protein [Campylobacterota bacterium]